MPPRFGLANRALRWVLAYIVGAALWIGVMQWLLRGLGGADWSISTAGLVVGGVFVLVTAWMLYLLLERTEPDAATTNASTAIPVQWPGWLLLGGLIVGTLGAQLFMVWYATREYRPVLLDQAQTELTSQLRLHSKLLDDWFAQHQKLVEGMAAEKEALIGRLKQTEANPAQSHLPEFARLITQGQFEGIAVFNADHQRKLQFGSDAAGKGADDLYEKAAATSSVQFACTMPTHHLVTECYWVLPVFLSTQEVSGGPWFVMFNAALSESALMRAASASAASVPIERAVRSLLLLMPSGGTPSQWQAMPLISEFSRLTSPQLAQAIAPLSAADRDCVNQSALMTPAAKPLDKPLDKPLAKASDSLSDKPPAKVAAIATDQGQIQCNGLTVLYAAARVPQIDGLLWAATTQEAVLLPLLHTRRWFAGAALLGISAFLVALLFFWRLLSRHQQRLTQGLIRSRDDCAAVWANLPAVGLAIVEAASGRVNSVNSRWAQLFQTSQTQAQGEALSQFLRPAPGLTAQEHTAQLDAQWLAELSSGLREEVQIVRYIAVGVDRRAWMKFSLKAQQVPTGDSPTWLVLAEALGDAVIDADATRAERDFYRWLAQIPTERAAGVDTAGAESSEHLSPQPPAQLPVQLPGQLPDQSTQPWAGIAEGLMGQTSVVALCLYTHWPAVWASAPDLSGPVLEHQEQQAYQCEGCTAPVRAMANEIARMGIIERVLVAQTPIFIDDAVRQAQNDTATGVQAELIEQLRTYPVGALAVVPLPPNANGQTRAWIAFGADGLRFTDPVRSALLSLLNRLSAQLPAD